MNGSDAAARAQDPSNLRRLVDELRAEVRMAGVICDSLIKTCAPLLALYDGDLYDDLTWDELVGIAAEDLAELRRDRNALLAAIERHRDDTDVLDPENRDAALYAAAFTQAEDDRG